MDILWRVFLGLLMILPWIAMALAAWVALLRNKDSRILQMQALGAAGFFLLTIGQGVLEKLLLWTHAPSWLLGGTHALFGFFIFVSLATFALGFCLEKLSRKNGPVQVTATRVDA